MRACSVALGAIRMMRCLVTSLAVLLFSTRLKSRLFRSRSRLGNVSSVIIRLDSCAPWPSSWRSPCGRPRCASEPGIHVCVSFSYCVADMSSSYNSPMICTRGIVFTYPPLLCQAAIAREECSENTPVMGVESRRDGHEGGGVPAGLVRGLCISTAWGYSSGYGLSWRADPGYKSSMGMNPRLGLEPPRRRKR